MNNCYHYKYSNGLQFVSRASLTLLTVALAKRNVEIPKLIGVWKFKNLKNEKRKGKAK